MSWQPDSELSKSSIRVSERVNSMDVVESKPGAFVCVCVCVFFWTRQRGRCSERPFRLQNSVTGPQKFELIGLEIEIKSNILENEEEKNVSAAAFIASNQACTHGCNILTTFSWWHKLCVRPGRHTRRQFTSSLTNLHSGDGKG